MGTLPDACRNHAFPQCLGSHSERAHRSAHLRRLAYPRLLLDFSPIVKRLKSMTRILIAACLVSLGLVLGNAASAVDVDSKAPPDAPLDAMIGQMIMVGFSGSSERDAGVVAVRDQLNKGTIGGVVLYPENIGQPTELRGLTAFLRNAKSSPVPFIGV